MVTIADGEELKQRLRRKSREAKQRADELLAEELSILAKATAADLDALRPKVTDAETYAKLRAAVEESTRRNEDLAQLRDRLVKAGSAVQAMAKEVLGLLGRR